MTRYPLLLLLLLVILPSTWPAYILGGRRGEGYRRNDRRDPFRGRGDKWKFRVPEYPVDNIIDDLEDIFDNNPSEDYMGNPFSDEYLSNNYIDDEDAGDEYRRNDRMYDLELGSGFM